VWNSTKTDPETCESDSPTADHLEPDDTADPDHYFDVQRESSWDLL
jgi:hypothetical protein